MASRRLAQRTAVLVITEIQVFETGESTRLEIPHAVHQADIELPFLPARIIHVLALRLDGVHTVGAERREHLSVGRCRKAARLPGPKRRSDIHADIRKDLRSEEHTSE